MTSVSASLFCKILTVFLLFCLAKASGGTCLSYGHSCWGGHGKRNGLLHFVGGNSQKRMGERYISRLFNPSVVKQNKIEDLYSLQNQEDDDSDKIQKYGYQIYPIVDTAEVYPRDETKYSQEMDVKTNKWDGETKNSDDDIVFLMPGVQQRAPVSKYRFFQILDRANGKRKFDN